MEMIYHVHLTKTDFENIKHLQLAQAFRHLQLLSPPKKIHILKIMMVVWGHNENCTDENKLELRNWWIEKYAQLREINTDIKSGKWKKKRKKNVHQNVVYVFSLMGRK